MSNDERDEALTTLDWLQSKGENVPPEILKLRRQVWKARLRAESRRVNSLQWWNAKPVAEMTPSECEAALRMLRRGVESAHELGWDTEDYVTGNDDYDV